MAARAWVLGLLLLSSGCLTLPREDGGTDSPTCVTPTMSARIPTFNGTGRFELNPTTPVLRPGEPLELTVRFTNPDCQAFHFRRMGLLASNTLLRIGSAWDFVSTGGDVALRPLARSSAGPEPPLETIEPGRTFAKNVTWDGSVELWDHAHVALTGVWREETYWLEPGAWNMSFGFERYASYAVDNSTILQVEGNDRNVGATAFPRTCQALHALNTFSDVTVEVSPSRAPIGSVVRVFANYTLRVPAPGCYLFEGEPMAEWDQGPSSRHSLGRQCARSYKSADPFTVIVRANATEIPVHLAYEWDGSGEADPFCRAAANPGPSKFVFAEPISLGGRHPVTNATFEWLPPGS